MQEHHAVVGVHRAIDLLVEEHPERTGLAATMFPSYDAGGAGWSTVFARMLIDHEVVGSIEDVYPDLVSALEQLAELPPATTWQAVRRLQALAALIRVSPDHAPGGDSAPLVEHALAHLSASDGGAEELHELLLDPEVLNHASWRHQVTELLHREVLA